MSGQKSRVRLTAGRVADFVCPAGKSQAFLWDTDTPALMLRATPTGRKTYAFESRLNGNTIRVTIGTAAEWSLGPREAGTGWWGEGSTRNARARRDDCRTASPAYGDAPKRPDGTGY